MRLTHTAHIQNTVGHLADAESQIHRSGAEVRDTVPKPPATPAKFQSLAGGSSDTTHGH